MSLLENQEIRKREYRDNHQIFNTPNYQELDREVKMEMLWDQLMKVRKVKCQDWDKIWRNFQQNPELSFKKVQKPNKRKVDKENEKKGFGDEMMIDSNTENVRQKYVHQQGIVTKARYVPLDQSFERGYSGIFDSGADEVILRFSEAGQILQGVSQALNPSVAMKFLRNNVNSANQFGMVGFDN